jgi:hypothetical protein
VSQSKFWDSTGSVRIMLTLIWNEHLNCISFFLGYNGRKVSAILKKSVESLIEVFRSPTIVRRKFQEQFQRGPPSRLTFYRMYEKFVRTGLVADNYKGNAGRHRTGRKLCGEFRGPALKFSTQFSVKSLFPNCIVW